MLEGAKSIGAGAATIALAGAAIGIGNVLSSSIHSGIYFLSQIQIFTFFTFIILMLVGFMRKGATAKFQSVSSSIFLFFIRIFFRFPHLYSIIRVALFGGLLFFRLILPVLQVVTQLYCPSFLVSLPPEILQNPQTQAHLEGLNFYLGLHEQDPEWVAFIQQELNHNTPPEEIPLRLKLFVHEEKTSCLRRDLIQDFITKYNRNEALFPLEPYLLEEAVRSYLDHIGGTENFAILQAGYQDLWENEGESVFFSSVVSHNREFIDAQTSARRCLEEARRMRWEGIYSIRAQLEKTEHEHAMLYFQYWDRKRGA